MQRALDDEADLAPEPIEQFGLLVSGGTQLPGHCGGECDGAGDGFAPPASRMRASCLLKGFDAKGFVFFTNYCSDKGRDLDENPRAALTFGWIEQERQVRIEGDGDTRCRAPRLRPISRVTSARQPAGRVGVQPERCDSRIAHSSRSRLAEAEAQHLPNDVPPPATWGGYCLAPEQVEFWQGRTSRLHDRLRYRKADGAWVVERLAP